MSDPLQALLEDLRSPDPAIRFSVLTRVEHMTWSADQIAGIQRLLAGDLDGGTRFHLQKIVARAEKGRQATTAREVETLLAARPRDDLALALALESVAKAEAPLVAMALREADWPSFSPEVLPFVIAFFKKHGSFEDAEPITAMCRHAEPRVLAAAVEALEKLAPDHLQALIVPLLVSPIHGIRSRAVRLLYRWDRDEAIRHLEDLLFSEDLSDRHAALFHAFLFPFPDIEPLLARFLGVEADRELLGKAGLLFRSNPSTEELWRLLEIMESSRGEKRQLIGEILTGVIRSLSEAGLVEQSPEAILAHLQVEYRQRKGRQLVEQSRVELGHAEPETRRTAIQRLIELHRREVPDVLPVLQQHAPVETDPINRQILAQVIGTPAVAPPDAPATVTLTGEAFLKLDRDARIETIGTLDRARFGALRASMAAALKQADSFERQGLLEAIARLGLPGDANLVAPYLQDSDSRVVGTAIESLSNLDADKLFPFLPKLLQHPSDEVRATAVRVFALFDKKQALALVEKMFLAAQPRQRGLGIFCAAQFDFPSVRDLLVKNFERERDPHNLEQIAVILRENPEEALLVDLVRIRPKVPDEQRPLVTSLIEHIGNKLLAARATAHPDLAAMVSAAEDRIAEDEKRRRSEQPSYSVSNIRKMRAGQTRPGAPAGAAGAGATADPEGEGGIGWFTAKAFGIGFLISAVIIAVFILPDAWRRDAPGGRGTVTSTRGDPGPSTPDFTPGEVDIDGRIIYVDPTGSGVQVKTAEGNTTYYVTFKTPQVGKYTKGERFQARVNVTTSRSGTLISDFVRPN